VGARHVPVDPVTVHPGLWPVSPGQGLAEGGDEDERQRRLDRMPRGGVVVVPRGGLEPGRRSLGLGLDPGRRRGARGAEHLRVVAAEAVQ